MQRFIKYEYVDNLFDGKDTNNPFASRRKLFASKQKTSKISLVLLAVGLFHREVRQIFRQLIWCYGPFFVAFFDVVSLQVQNNVKILLNIF